MPAAASLARRSFRKSDRVRRVAVHANRVGLDRDIAAVDRAHHLFAQHAEDALCCFLGIVQERVRLGARDERTVGLIIAIGKNFARNPQPDRLAGAGERAAARREKE